MATLNTYPFSNPVGISKNLAKTIGLDAVDHRRGQGALSQPQHGNTYGALTGVFPGGTGGAGASNDLAYSSVSGLTVGFNAGHYGSDRGAAIGLYLGFAYQGWSVTLADGDAVNPRIDTVVIRTKDPGVDGESVTETAYPVILKGTPAATPSKPGGMISGDVPLWSFTVGGGSNYRTIIANEDERLFIVARGGIYPRRAGDDRPGAYEGQYRDNLVANTLERWSGTAWDVVASRAAWDSFTPKLYSAAGECQLGNGGSAFGRYIVEGKTLKFRYEFRAVRPCNLGYGQIYTTLPPNVISAASRESHVYAKINVINSVIFPGEAFIPPNSTRVEPYFPAGSDKSNILFYRVAEQAGIAGKSQPYVGNGFADPSILHISGQIEIQ